MGNSKMSDDEYLVAVKYLNDLGCEYTISITVQLKLYAVSTYCQLHQPLEIKSSHLASWHIAENEEEAIKQAQDKGFLVNSLGWEPAQVQSSCVLIPQRVIDELATIPPDK